MNTTNSQLQTTGQISEQKKSIMDWLNDPVLKEQIKMALPKHMTPDRMLRVVMTELRRIPKLQQCDPISFAGCIVQCSQLGLEPGGHLGHVHLIPFENKKKNTVECQVIIGYKGMLELATRSGVVSSPQVNAVYEKDFFEFEYGLTPKLRHIPARENRGEMIYVYACVSIKGGGNQFEVMSIEEVNSIKARSKASNYGPWQTDYEQMARKTVIRRLFKYLPVSIELSQAISLDEGGDQGEQYNELLIESSISKYEKPTTKSSSLSQMLSEKFTSPTEQGTEEILPMDSDRIDEMELNDLITLVKGDEALKGHLLKEYQVEDFSMLSKEQYLAARDEIRTFQINNEEKIAKSTLLFQ